jgi:hypothetical protein
VGSAADVRRAAAVLIAERVVNPAGRFQRDSLPGLWSRSGHKRPGIRWIRLVRMDDAEHEKHVMDARRQPRFSL